MTKNNIVQITSIEMTKINSCANGKPPSASARTTIPKPMPPPRMRQSIGRRSLDSDRINSTPKAEMAGMIEAEKKYRLTSEKMRKPSG